MWIRKEDKLQEVKEDIPVIVWVNSGDYDGWIPSLFSEGKFYFNKEDISDIVQYWTVLYKPDAPESDKVDIKC